MVKKGNADGIPLDLQLVVRGEDIQNLGLGQLGLTEVFPNPNGNPNDPAYCLTAEGRDLMTHIKVFFSLSQSQRKVLSLIAFGPVEYPEEQKQ